VLDGVLEYRKINGGYFDIKRENVLACGEGDGLTLGLVPPYQRTVPDDHFGLATYLLAMTSPDPSIQPRLYHQGQLNHSLIQSELHRLAHSWGYPAVVIVEALLRREDLHSVREKIRAYEVNGTPVKEDRSGGGQGLSESHYRPEPHYRPGTRSRSKPKAGINLSLTKNQASSSHKLSHINKTTLS
jgi:hypothetical protein